MSDISNNIAVLQQNIQAIPHSQALLCLAVSKQQSPMRIRDAHQAGLHAFGENYLQEALPKIDSLQDLALEWHYIGQIQGRKCKKIAQYFDWVETVDDLKLAEKLNACNQELGKKQYILIQVNLFDEPQKSGCSINELDNLLKVVRQLSALNCRGLMTILPQALDKEAQLNAYRRLNQLMHHYNQALNLTMDTLSMGMSDDYPQAIQAGSNIIRIGQAIFGPRSY
ncbi:MAG: YggS family pyridoxal phosphate-dependent enzyme [Gammaproteobacteria bacterium]|nr:YggS family pyridoxal phosphate-dependent enzyme [Gammaproteobacteria bacterium]